MLCFQMRFTKRVSVWPVGLVGYLRYESPIIKSGKVCKLMAFRITTEHGVQVMSRSVTLFGILGSYLFLHSWIFFIKIMKISAKIHEIGKIKAIFRLGNDSHIRL